tara:strand:- start:581 stop:3493 length:2913 start_codon:yes stop_codon:yes gene_type:complete
MFDSPSSGNSQGLPKDFDGFRLHNSSSGNSQGLPKDFDGFGLHNSSSGNSQGLSWNSPLNTSSSSINSSRRSPSIKNYSPSDYNQYVAKLGYNIPPYTTQTGSPSLPSSQNDSPIRIIPPPQPESDSPIPLSQKESSNFIAPPPTKSVSYLPKQIDNPNNSPQSSVISLDDISLVVAPSHSASIHNSSKSSVISLDDISLVDQYSSISVSSLFSNISDLQKSPSNYEGFVKLLKIINDNQEYGYRWIKLKYLNNTNYDLCDLNNNNTIIYGCNDKKCLDYNRVTEKFKTFFVNYLKVSKTPYPGDQINPNNTGGNFYHTIIKNPLFDKISNLITTIKTQNIFKEVIIGDSNCFLIAYNKLKIYNLIFINQVLHVELSQDTTMKLQQLRLPKKTIFSTIYKASIRNFKFAAKLSLCDNKKSKSKKSYLEEIYLFDLVTKYAINKININLPIIYKTIQLNPNTSNIQKKFGFIFEIFGQDTFFNYDEHNKNCDLGENSTINCSICELYSGNCYMYIYDKDLKTDSSTYFNYLLNGFENIIISILSFWSVTKCLHRDTQMSNFLYKKLKSTHDFNNYNIHGKKLYIKNLKCQWTLWDYGSCLPFLYENYFKPINKNNLKSYDDIHMSVYLYCNNILNEHICQTYTKELYNIFHNDKNLEPIQLKTIYYINIFIINQILSGKRNEYYNNTNLFFQKMLYFIYKLNIVNITPAYIKKIENIEQQLNDYNYNLDIDFILKEFNRPRDTNIVNFVDANLTKKTHELNNFFLNETKICLICGKFIYNYLWYKNDYQKEIIKNIKKNDYYKIYNYTNNIVLMVMKVIKQLKIERFQNKKIIISTFLNNYDLFATTIKNTDTTSPNYYIGNEYIGNCWIKIKNIKDKNLKNIRGSLTEKNYNYLIRLFDINYKYIENEYIIKIPLDIADTENYIDNIKSIYDLLNSDIAYKHNYYILYNDQFFVPYNDINYKLYTSLNKK